VLLTLTEFHGVGRDTLARGVAVATTDGIQRARPEVKDSHWTVVRERHIRADLAKAAVPLARLKAWRYLTALGVRRGLLDSNAGALVEPPPAAATTGHEPWSADDVAAFRARWPVGTFARSAMELLMWTGAWIGDAFLIGPQHVDSDGVLCFRQSKTGDMAYVPWTCALPAYAAGMDADRAAMRAALPPRRALTFLATEAGRTRSSKALGTLIREASIAAGLTDRTAHGLRKARAVALADAGATTHQIAAWTGHKTLKEIERYTARAARRHAVMGTAPDELKKSSA
jgi:integrase